MRCVVLENQAVFAELLGGMLHSLGDVVVVLATNRVREAAEACRHHRPELLLLDPEIPGGDAFSVAMQLKHSSPRSRAIILSDSPVPLKIPPELKTFIYSAIDRSGSLGVLRGEIWRFRSESAIAPASSASTSDPADILGPREREMFGLIGRGFRSKEIAGEMNLSKASVDTYRKRIAAKLRSSGADLVRLAALHSRMPLAA